MHIFYEIFEEYHYEVGQKPSLSWVCVRIFCMSVQEKENEQYISSILKINKNVEKYY